MNAAGRKKLQTDLWRESALLVGERLRDNGPMDYYKMTALEWRDWALETAVSRNRVEAAEAKMKELEAEARTWRSPQQILRLDAEARCAELEALFALQRTRMTEATRVWQAATGKQDVLPDLGDLLAWLMDRPAALEKAARQVIKASPKCVGKEMLLALTELDTALAEAREGKEESRE